MKEMDKKHMGMHMIILGGLILLNVYWMKLEWGAFIGGVLVLGGLTKVIHRCTCKGK